MPRGMHRSEEVRSQVERRSEAVVRDRDCLLTQEGQQLRVRAYRDSTRVQGNVRAAPARAGRVSPPLRRGLFTRAEDTHAHPQTTRRRNHRQASIPRARILNRHLDARSLRQFQHRARQLVGDGQADGTARKDTRSEDANGIRQAVPLPARTRTGVGR